MKISIYGPLPDPSAVAEILRHLPADAKDVVVQAPPRNSMDRRPCQQPGWLVYTASVDNSKFITVVQRTDTGPFEVQVS